MSPLTDLTIVIPTRNKAANIEIFLASVPPEVELIIVDNSDDETAAIVRRRRPSRTVLLHCGGSLTIARETGARAARSRWLLFADADVRFSPSYFATLTKLLERSAGAALLFGSKLSADDYIGHYRRLSIAQGLLARLKIPAASGSTMLVTSEASAAVGGFDTSLPCNEDSELGWRIARAGFAWRHEPRLVVYATDQRRLRRGPLRKTLHTVFRCTTLYLNLIPQRWRSHDWGYWRAMRRTTK